MFVATGAAIVDVAVAILLSNLKQVRGQNCAVLTNVVNVIVVVVVVAVAVVALAAVVVAVAAAVGSGGGVGGYGISSGCG